MADHIVWGSGAGTVLAEEIVGIVGVKLHKAPHSHIYYCT